MKFSINFLILAAIVAGIKAQDYSHGDQSAWYDNPNWECNGDLQSPIELDSDNAVKAFGKLQFVNYNVPVPVTLSNNGHTVEIQIPPNTAYCTGIWLADRYNLHSAHAHWGSSDAFGSEHVVDGKRHSIELHLVHYNSKYGSLDEASKHRDGILVVGILLQVSADQQNGWPDINSIVTALPTISDVGASVQLNNFLFSNLIDAVDCRTFFNYQGSLTTPPCAESVNWFVCSNPIPITADVAHSFRSLRDPNGNALENNHRCLQPINNRKVRFFFGL